MVYNSLNTKKKEQTCIVCAKISSLENFVILTFDYTVTTLYKLNLRNQSASYRNIYLCLNTPMTLKL